MKRLFLTSEAFKVLDKFVDLFKIKPKDLTVAFIPTAAELYKDPWFMEADKKKLIELGFKIIEIDLNSKKTVSDLKKSDIIFIAGGNTFYLLEKLRKNKIDELIKFLVNKGKIYVGSSAGSVVACKSIEYVKSIDDPEKALGLDSYGGLGLFNHYILPHADDQKFKDKFDKIFDDFPKLKKDIIKIGNNQAIFVQGDKWEIV